MLLYIASTSQVVSTVLVVEREEAGKIHDAQRPVYYLSEVITPAKQRYPHHQKLAYAVWMTARKLRHYFAEHLIIDITEAPLKNILTNPGLKRNMGSGTRIVLISPHGDKMKYVLRMNFPLPTNNEAEYKALLHGMHMVKACGATRLEIYGDSNLAVQQSMNLCNVISDNMVAYREMYRRQMEGKFEGCELKHIGRASNEEADSLANIGSACSEILDTVFYEFFNGITCRFGLPHSIITDNGSNFASDEFHKFCEGLSIKLNFSSVSHPQTNELKLFCLPLFDSKHLRSSHIMREHLYKNSKTSWI
ncbi:hypothetical protein QYE76_043027 [Lolium multiflorum]|uniref:Uncharacterized protein n=1 Tax=Lolium multiflorum TaxID=4521 RepID=A0AAD8TGF3_LOLMU|nr:hypothetical protein QYE76_043027 [Lolium multiflorum]